MSGAELLRDAADLVARGWCQGAEARNSAGEPTQVNSPDAVEWSLLGALQAAALRDPSITVTDIAEAVAALAELIANPVLADWNDVEQQTSSEVVSVLEHAAVLAAPAA